jgi:ubiquinone/menaquinone biosynthesis C-methylase UbiE
MNNKLWSEKFLQKFDPGFKHRWVVFNELLTESLSSDSIWLDCGAGNNQMIKGFRHLAKNAIGIDLVNPEFRDNYVKADIRSIPFKSDFADLITLRFVVEHFSNPQSYFKDLSRVLKRGGKIIILTTNILSPVILLPKLLLPYSLKSFLLTKIFKVKDKDVFPAFHRINSAKKFRKIGNGLETKKIQFISDLNITRKWMFIVLLIIHLITKPRPLNKFRTNLLVILEKL